MGAHAWPGRLLDVGCAAGLFLEVMGERGWRLEGLEPSAEASAVARGRAGVTVHEGPFEDVVLPEEAYDAVAMLDVLEHLASPRAAVRRVRGLLRPGGTFMIVVPSYRNLTTTVALAALWASRGRLRGPAEGVHQLVHLSYFTPRTLTRLLREEGFEVVATRPDATVLELLDEPLAVRAGLTALFALSRPLRLQNKVAVIARRPEAAGPVVGPL